MHQFPVAVHIFLFRGEKVLLLRRFNTGYQDGKYSVVAGHVESGETITQAAVREAKEEVGVGILPRDLDVVGVMHRKSDEERVDFFLVTRVWSGEPRNQELDRCDQLVWVSVGELPVNTIPYVRRALENHGGKRVWFEEFGW